MALDKQRWLEELWQASTGGGRDLRAFGPPCCLLHGSHKSWETTTWHLAPLKPGGDRERGLRGLSHGG